jgi:hypothetical protein
MVQGKERAGVLFCNGIIPLLAIRGTNTDRVARAKQSHSEILETMRWMRMIVHEIPLGNGLAILSSDLQHLLVILAVRCSDHELHQKTKDILTYEVA